MNCATYDCGEAGVLRCPTCVKLEIDDVAATYFCSQSCFRSFWPEHKMLHQPSTRTRQLDISAQRRRQAFEDYEYTGDLRVAHVKLPRREVPSHIPRPDYAEDGIPKAEERFNRIKASFRILDEDGIEGMRTVCRLAREVLDIAVRKADVGVTTEEIDQVVHEACIERDAYPSPLNYYGFPKSCCTSVNEVICHGIPDMRPLENGDLLNIDITLYYGGFHGDLNETIIIGEASKENKKLVKSAYDALWAGIKLVRPGTLLREFGTQIEKVVRKNGHSVVRSYCGHGINEQFHPAPTIPHYRKNKAVGMCKEGMTFTLEPMVNLGNWRDRLWPDRWTAVTDDGKPSAQFEHTLLVTKDGCEVLTARLPDGPRFWWEEE